MINSIIEILIDASGSMGYMKGAKEFENKYLIDGLTRMTLIKKMLLTDIIPTIDYCSSIFIRTFRTAIEEGDGKLIQKEIQTSLIYEGGFDKSKIESAIGAIMDPPLGGTPISAAIDIAVLDLEKYTNHDRKIILLTDGEENGGGDYKLAAKKAFNLTGIPCKIFIVGIAQDMEAEKKSKEIANGGYINLNSSKFSAVELKIALAPIKAQVIQNSITNIQSQFKVNSVIQQTSTQQSPQVPSKIFKETATEKNDQPINTVEKLINRIETIKKDSYNADFSIQIDGLEASIREQISNSQKLLSEILSVKNNIRLNSLLETGINSTNLSIDDEYSEYIRQLSEAFVYEILLEKYSKSNVKWLNENGESYQPHDFELIDDQGNVIQIIECKGTPKQKPTFYLTEKEWHHFLKNKDIYQIYRVFNIESEIEAFQIENLFVSISSCEVVPYLISPEVLDMMDYVDFLSDTYLELETTFPKNFRSSFLIQILSFVEYELKKICNIHGEFNKSVFQVKDLKVEYLFCNYFLPLVVPKICKLLCKDAKTILISTLSTDQILSDIICTGIPCKINCGIIVLKPAGVCPGYPNLRTTLSSACATNGPIAVLFAYAGA